jgi:hypothetical protein
VCVGDFKTDEGYYTGGFWDVGDFSESLFVIVSYPA